MQVLVLVLSLLFSPRAFAGISVTGLGGAMKARIQEQSKANLKALERERETRRWKAIQARAKAGDVDSQIQLSLAYWRGKEIRRNRKKALGWMKRAAAKSPKARALYRKMRAKLAPARQASTQAFLNLPEAEGGTEPKAHTYEFPEGNSPPPPEPISPEDPPSSQGPPKSLRRLLASRGPTFLVFRQDGCPPCDRYEPIAKRVIRQEHKKELHVLDLASELGGELSYYFEVQATPTTVVLDPKGKVLQNFPGGLDAQGLEKLLESLD